jgi:transmembrane protein 222
MDPKKSSIHSHQLFDTDESYENTMDTKASKKVKVSDKVGVLNPELARFPFCITWTPLPMITWFLPCIGHTGLCDSEGVIHDFAGPYYVSLDDFAFGETHKYV